MLVIYFKIRSKTIMFKKLPEKRRSLCLEIWSVQHSGKRSKETSLQFKRIISHSELLFRHQHFWDSRFRILFTDSISIGWTSQVSFFYIWWHFYADPVSVFNKMSNFQTENRKISFYLCSRCSEFFNFYNG